MSPCTSKYITYSLDVKRHTSYRWGQYNNKGAHYVWAQIFPTFERILPVVYLGNLISKDVKNRNKNVYTLL